MTMTSTQSNFMLGLLGACRVLGLVAVLFVGSAGVLGFAVSVHMAQVFERVSTLHPTALPLGAGRLSSPYNSL